MRDNKRRINTPPGMLEAPKLPKREFAPPAGYRYLTWQETDVVHLTHDSETTACGKVNDGAAKSMMTNDPFGKPRCFVCLKALEIEPVSGEPRPYRPDHHLEKPEPTEVQQLDPPAAGQIQPLKMPPPEFFNTVRKS